MKPEGSSPCLQEPVTCPYLEPKSLKRSAQVRGPLFHFVKCKACTVRIRCPPRQTIKLEACQLSLPAYFAYS
jgi:hypothetical protein